MSINETSTAAVQLVPCLPLVEPPVESGTEKRKDLVLYQLKMRAGAVPADTNKYKLYVRRFYDGTPRKLIWLLMMLDEIWMQNGLTWQVTIWRLFVLYYARR